jgi:hypothetical protein
VLAKGCLLDFAAWRSTDSPDIDHDRITPSSVIDSGGHEKAFARLDLETEAMNTTKLPKHYVEAITCERLVDYLRANGWKQTAVIEEGEVVVYRHRKKPNADILVPLTKKYADYLHRIADAIVTVGDVEKRPFWEVYMDMSGRYYVAPHTYSTTPLSNGSTNGAPKKQEPTATVT